MTPRSSIAAACQVTWLTVQAWIALAAFDVARAGGFKRIHEQVRRSSIDKRAVVDRCAADIVWAVDEACVWYVKRVHCLQRSVVATRLLRQHGIRAELVIGYRPIPFESHAWVEVDGQVVNDRPQYQRAFAVLDRL